MRCLLIMMCFGAVVISCESSRCVRHSDCAAGLTCSATGFCEQAPADAAPSDDGGVSDDGGASAADASVDSDAAALDAAPFDAMAREVFSDEVIPIGSEMTSGQR